MAITQSRMVDILEIANRAQTAVSNAEERLRLLQRQIKSDPSLTPYDIGITLEIIIEALHLPREDSVLVTAERVHFRKEWKRNESRAKHNATRERNRELAKAPDGNEVAKRLEATARPRKPFGPQGTPSHLKGLPLSEHQPSTYMPQRFVPEAEPGVESEEARLIREEAEAQEAYARWNAGCDAGQDVAHEPEPEALPLPTPASPPEPSEPDEPGEPGQTLYTPKGKPVPYVAPPPITSFPLD